MYEMISFRMGLPVDNTDINGDKCEQQGEGGESQSEAYVDTPPPTIRKRKKGKKRYLGSPLLCTSYITGKHINIWAARPLGLVLKAP